MSFTKDGERLGFIQIEQMQGTDNIISGFFSDSFAMVRINKKNGQRELRDKLHGLSPLLKFLAVGQTLVHP